MSAIETSPDRAANYRPEVQALRALAVAIVVVYHFWPTVLRGGFVGVDVFFVISGFLITGGLVRESLLTGRLTLGAFWSRRIRRLLPSALIVLAATAIATALLLPRNTWIDTFRQITASALYVQNWVLASDSVDYLASENAASPVQHFWSLSVEEQFYIAIPVLMAITLLVVRSRARLRKPALVILLATITVVSLAYSAYATQKSPASAYFETTTRAWEFALGGLLVFVPVGASRFFPAVRAVVGWLGWVGILVVAVTYNNQTPFPGVAALAPVAATMAVIWAGSSPVPWAPHRIMVNRASIFVGNVSYSVYLWHWPVLLFTAALLSSTPSTPLRVALVGVTLLLAWATTALVENPVRRSRRMTIGRTFGAGALAMVLVVTPVAVSWLVLREDAARQLRLAAEAAAQQEACFGAGFRDPENDCSGVEFASLTPGPDVVREDRPATYLNGCLVLAADEGVPLCHLGDPNGITRVAIVGDSHINAMTPALDIAASQLGWKVTTYLKSACTLSTAVKPESESVLSCRAWIATVAPMIAAAKYDIVVVSHSVGGDASITREEAIAGFRGAWSPLIASGAEIVVIRDVPRMTDETNTCLEANLTRPSHCDRPIDESLPYDAMAEAARGMAHVHLIDLTDTMCWDGTCKSTVGGVVVFRDYHHISSTFSITLAPQLTRALDALRLA
ncbi:MAG: acyltransferase [Actinobacteria bacterium]|nr:acyltransferase [Actinomycetota bacterium]